MSVLGFLRDKRFWLFLGLATAIYLLIPGGGVLPEPTSLTPPEDYQYKKGNYSGLLNGWVNIYTPHKPNKTSGEYNGVFYRLDYQGLMEVKNQSRHGFLLESEHGYLDVVVNTSHRDARISVADGRYGVVYIWRAMIQGRGNITDAETYLKPVSEGWGFEFPDVWQYRYYLLLLLAAPLGYIIRGRMEKHTVILDDVGCMQALKNYLWEKRDVAWLGWGRVEHKPRFGCDCYLIEFLVDQEGMPVRGLAYVCVEGGSVLACSNLRDSLSGMDVADEFRRFYKSGRRPGRPNKLESVLKENQVLQDKLKKKREKGGGF